MSNLIGSNMNASIGIKLTGKDIDLLKDKGISINSLEKQLENFTKGFPYANIVRPAVNTDGIIVINEDEQTDLIRFYEHESKKLIVVKFVPASGAATRMFKELFEFVERVNGPEKESASLVLSELPSVENLLSNIQKMAFYDDLKSVMQRDGIVIDECLKHNNFVIVIDYLLSKKGLNYAERPKALILFHNYSHKSRTAFEEHLVESEAYCKDVNDKVRLHFTISAEHEKGFIDCINSCIKEYQDKYRASFDIGFSNQKSSTDIVAVDMNNTPYRDEDGGLLFRPGGHGALIENLNDIDADIVFVKNIDNVVTDYLKETTYYYKKVIGGMLVSVREKIFNSLNTLDKEILTDEVLSGIEMIVHDELNLYIDKSYYDLSLDKKRNYLKEVLNRPIRICGMVRNEGEPGGGPFWVLSEGKVSLQIVEAAQIDKNDPTQMSFLNESTHFNPVDLVCCLKDYKGESFDLKKYVDPKTGFISLKSNNGTKIKAQELPGLWNGAMANWISLFVEVPLITFNPVKTVSDLLKKEHIVC